MLKIVQTLVAVSFCTLPLAAAAQTADELAEKFNNQLGTTRGLVLAPATDQATAPVSSNTGTTDVAVAAAEETYIAIPKEDQVNLQISFDFDSSALRDDQKPKLTSMCEVMKSVDIKLFRIVGHTDASGSADYNRTLSQLRAEEVKRFLVSDCGVESSRLEAVGVGESFLLDSSDPKGDANRRVEFQALS